MIQILSFIEHFDMAWRQIGSIYSAGKICSERHLQAELFHQLYSNPLFLQTYELRVEPCMYYFNMTKNRNEVLGFTPDMLIINRNEEILGCVELKYVPHGYVQFEKDMANMFKMWDLKNKESIKFYLDTVPESGDWNYQKPYALGNNFHLIYGVIGNEFSDGIMNYKRNWTQPINHPLEIQYRQFIGSISDNNDVQFYMAQ